MKKSILFGILVLILPNYVFGYSARYEELVAEKQRKMEELEKCTGNVNAWKIAGISTIGLTAVGVVGNIALSNTKKDYDKKIANTDVQINQTKTNISELQEKKRLAAEEENKKRSACELIGGEYNNGTCTCKDPNKEYKDGNCVDKEKPKITEPTETADCTAEAKAKDAHVTRAEKNDAGACEVQECENGYIVSADKTKCDLIDKGKDCTETAKQNDSNITKAVMNGTKCEVTECKNGYTPSADKTKCVKKKVVTQTTINGCQYKGKTYPFDTELTMSKAEFNSLGNNGRGVCVDEHAAICDCICTNQQKDEQLEDMVIPRGIYWGCNIKKCEDGYFTSDGILCQKESNTLRNASNTNIGTGCDRALDLSGISANANGHLWSVTYVGGELHGSSSCDGKKCSCASIFTSFDVAGCTISNTGTSVTVQPFLQFCESYCAQTCANSVNTNADIRKLLFKATKAAQ